MNQSKLLSEENRSQEDRYILTRLKKEYERDLEEFKGEVKNE